jgi:cell division septum initiation protein DivIVA
MPEATTQAAPSPAETEDVFQGQQPTLDEFSRYRQSGELPARFKPAEAESAPADTLEETEKTEGEDPKLAPDSDPEETQEPKPNSKADKRILQLLEKNKELERKLAGKQDVKTESSPAPVPQTTRSKPTADDKNQDGTQKFGTYEDFVEELADWKAEQRWESAKREQQQQEALKVLQNQLDEARSRYDDVDDVIFPASQAIQNAQIPIAVKEVFGQSDVFIDLCYVVGSDPDELKKFISLAQTNPRAAIGKVFEYERGIREELSKPRDDKGKFAAVPETKKTSAPKPPSPVGGASSRAFDVSDESLSPEEWARKRSQDIQKKRG